eukprot:TRINITY_DN14984_c0_g2_i2.p1 TRINITY_DN14984_c0_g2~~TRINITY_DN14984_c0_g2_i2.p1  ORF type:complete len:624 (-),score=80.31 TRINITY_DN14984_c0_g2_i2:114-1889(-)
MAPKSSSASYYKTIDGVRYDRELLDLSFQLASDGQLSEKDAMTLLEKAKDGRGLTEVEKRTLEYVLAHQKFTEKAREYMTSALSKEAESASDRKRHRSFDGAAASAASSGSLCSLEPPKKRHRTGVLERAKEAAENVRGFAGSSVVPALTATGHALAGATCAVGAMAVEVSTFGLATETNKALTGALQAHMKGVQHAAESAHAGWHSRRRSAPWFQGDAPTGLSTWMRALPDSTGLTELFIPGTHASLATRGGDTVRCQVWSLSSQLDAGIRAFDIRLRHMGDDLLAYHDGVDQRLDFNDIVQTLENFVAVNPAEVLFVRIRREGESGDHTRLFWVETYSRFLDRTRWDLQREAWGALGEARGRIILLDHESDIPLKGHCLSVHKHITDDHEVHAKSVIDHVTADRVTGSVHLTYLAAKAGDGSVKTPSSMAYHVNRVLMAHSRHVKAGIFMIDYPSAGLIQRLLRRNRSVIRVAREGECATPTSSVGDMSLELSTPVASKVEGSSLSQAADDTTTAAEQKSGPPAGMLEAENNNEEDDSSFHSVDDDEGYASPDEGFASPASEPETGVAGPADAPAEAKLPAGPPSNACA